MVVTDHDFKSGDDMIELHAVKRWFVFDKGGNKDYFFDATAVVEKYGAPEGPEEAQHARVSLVMLELGSRMGKMTANKVATVAMTKNVDNNNALAPENTP